jgi:GNAT superfamily N-acetyltransferase
LILPRRVITWRIKTKIREATAADTEIIAEFNARLAEETEDLILERECLSAGVAALFADPARGTYFLAEVDGEIAGQIMITHEWSDWRNGDLWWIQSVYVAEKFRQAGVFKALFNHVRSLADSRKDVSGIRLYMDSDNERARQVYKRLGFKETNYEVLEMDFVLDERKAQD